MDTSQEELSLLLLLYTCIEKKNILTKLDKKKSRKAVEILKLSLFALKERGLLRTPLK